MVTAAPVANAGVNDSNAAEKTAQPLGWARTPFPTSTKWDVPRDCSIEIVGGDPDVSEPIKTEALHVVQETLQMMTNSTPFDMAKHIVNVFNEKHGQYWAASVGIDTKLSSYFWYTEKNWVQLFNGTYRVDIWKQGC